MVCGEFVEGGQALFQFTQVSREEENCQPLGALEVSAWVLYPVGPAAQWLPSGHTSSNAYCTTSEYSIYCLIQGMKRQVLPSPIIHALRNHSLSTSCVSGIVQVQR